jgi:hypothetical protein
MADARLGIKDRNRLVIGDKEDENRKIVPLADLRAKLSADLDECGTEGPIAITRNGKTAGVLLVPSDDDDLERLLLGRSPRFQALLDRSRRSTEAGEGVSEESFWKAVRQRAQERKPSARRPARRGR